ncbi:DUF4190 domain-containing protein [Microbacterium sp. NPDC090281]|uniref:DUF4190 domain-containing protein n=1 Tax=Microbacterium sp. NPDC090281 TaxID=3364208 RepID=UPI0037F91649
MTNPPFPEPPTPDSSDPGTPPPAAPAAPPAPPAPAWDAAPSAAPAAPAAGYPAAGYPAPEAPVYPQPQPTPPGRVLSIVGLVLAFLVAPVGLIISIVAAVKLGKAKQPKGLAIAGIIVGALVTIFWIILVVILVAVAASLVGMCGELGAGVWEVNGVTYTCG